MLEDVAAGRREKLSAALVTRLDRVKAQGYEILPSKQTSGVTNLSAPVFGPLGSVIAVLTCPYTERLDKKDAPAQEAVLQLLRSAVAEISQRPTAPEG